MKRFTRHSILMVFAVIVSQTVPAGQASAQNATFIDRDISVTYAVRTQITTNFTGVGAQIDDSILLPDSQTQVERQTTPSGVVLDIGDRLTRQERVLIARGVRLTHTENVPVLVSVNTGVPLGGEIYEASGRQTRSMWLNDGSMNPGNARTFSNKQFNELNISNADRMIRDFDQYTQRLDAFLILETEIETGRQSSLRGHPDIGYTVQVVIEY